MDLVFCGDCSPYRRLGDFSVLSFRRKKQSDSIKDSLACTIALQLRDFSWSHGVPSYQDVQSLAEDKHGFLLVDNSRRFLLEELRVYEDCFQNPSGKFQMALTDVSSLLLIHTQVLETMQHFGPTTELENFYQKLQPYYQLLFDWERGSPISAALLNERILAIGDADSQPGVEMVDLLQDELKKIRDSAEEKEKSR